MFYFLPTLLTLLRIILTPVFLIMLFKGGNYLFPALFIFTLAALTDFVDGYFARKYNVVTKYGSFLDPLADKVLVVSAFIGFYFLGLVQFWMASLIVIRDVVITLLRIAILCSGFCMTTSYQAKSKTSFQFFAIYLIFAFLILDFKFKGSRLIFGLNLGVSIIMYLVVGLTVWTGSAYLIENKKFIVQIFRGEGGDDKK